MITKKSKKYIPSGDGYDVVEEYVGKSTDDKPALSRQNNGSTFFEMDTGKVYMYDGDTLTWLPQ